MENSGNSKRYPFISDITFAHIFLAIDSADRHLTIIEIARKTGFSYSTVQKIVAELQTMGCVQTIVIHKRKYVNVKTYFSTGHNCYFCTSNIPGL